MTSRALWFTAAIAMWAIVAPAQDLRREDQIILDATHQQQRPMRGRGPRPGSDVPGHSVGLPVRLELVIPSGTPQKDGTVLIDFVITNLEEAGITIPCSLRLINTPNRSLLSLWVSSDALPQFIELNNQDKGRQLIKIESPEISAELDGDSDAPGTFCTLSRGQSIRVHTSATLLIGELRPGVFAPLALKPGRHLFTGHAELLQVETSQSGQTSKLIGTADSENITEALSPK